MTGADLRTVSQPVFTQIADVIFMEALESAPMQARGSGIFAEEMIPANSGDSRTYTEYDLEEYAKLKGEGDQAERARTSQGYEKTIKPKRRGLDEVITVEMRKYNKYPEVITRLTKLGELVPNRMELDLQHRIGFGTATTYTDMDNETLNIATGDTLALFYSLHLLNGSSTTYRNILANNPLLSKGSIESMESMIINNTFNQLGQIMTLNYDILWTTDDANTVNTAREYLQSSADITSNNSGVVNVYKGKYRHVMLSRVDTDKLGAKDSTKAKYWGLASSSKKPGRLGIWESPFLISPSAGNASTDASTEDWMYGVRGSYGICFPTAIGITLSKGDGAA
jgi:hypothetical protein